MFVLCSKNSFITCAQTYIQMYNDITTVMSPVSPRTPTPRKQK